MVVIRWAHSTRRSAARASRKLGVLFVRYQGRGVQVRPVGWVWRYQHQTHPTGRTWTPRPWYRTKSTPSFLDALAALRRVLCSQRITTMSRPGAEESKITEALLDTLAYAA